MGPSLRHRPSVLPPTLCAALSLSLAACGGGGGGADLALRSAPINPGGALPSSYLGERPDAANYYTISGITAPGSYEYVGEDAVRIGIMDDAVDFTHPVFEGKIALDGATFSYWRPLASQANRGAFSACTDSSDNCRVFVNSSGSDTDIEEVARTILQEHGLPPKNDTWFLYDGSACMANPANCDYAWYELPALGDGSPDGSQHGTAVASVAIRVASENVAIVPLTLNFDPDDLFSVTLSTDNDQQYADAYAAWLRQFDIINGSYGVPGSWDDDDWKDEIKDDEIDYQTNYPKLHAAISQTDVPVDERTIRVWAAGNDRLGADGDFPTSDHHVKLYNFSDYWGREIIVTALNANETGIASYANYCRALPTNWDATTHGRHYCLAAPGTSVSVAVPGGNGFDDSSSSGTSFAAPYVAGVLAKMAVEFRGEVPAVDLVQRLVDTADNSGVFADPTVYGAGKVDQTNALQRQGRTSYVSPSGAKWDEWATALTLPSAYGDAATRLAGVEFAAFDEDGFPFWRPVSALVTSAHSPRFLIPTFDEAPADPHCGLDAELTGGARCLSADGTVRWSALAGDDGAGIGYAFSESFGMNAFTRSEGRLDGAGSGGLAFGGASSLLALSARRGWSLGESRRWSVDSRFTLAFDAPWGVGSRAQGMFEAGPSLLSSWEVSAAFRQDSWRTGLSLSQPPRAETGTGTLTYPAGRTLAGTPVFEHRSFSLVPSRREMTAVLRHEHDGILGGSATVSAWRTENPGHTSAAAEHGLAAAWRVRF